MVKEYPKAGSKEAIERGCDCEPEEQIIDPGITMRVVNFACPVHKEEFDGWRDSDLDRLKAVRAAARKRGIYLVK